MMAKKWRTKGAALLIDDELFIREVAGAMLEDIGLNVLEAGGGIEGLELYRQHQDDIVVVLLDMTMPGMGGVETFHQLQKINSEVKVIMSSGYSEQDVESKISGQGLCGFLQKPYLQDTLREAVKNAIEL